MNLCYYDRMYFCSAGKVWADKQSKCSHSVKSERFDRCLHWHPDNYCQSITAQSETVLTKKIAYDEI